MLALIHLSAPAALWQCSAHGGGVSPTPLTLQIEGIKGGANQLSNIKFISLVCELLKLFSGIEKYHTEIVY
jgi:hypothetical protein